MSSSDEIPIPAMSKTVGHQDFCDQSLQGNKAEKQRQLQRTHDMGDFVLLHCFLKSSLPSPSLTPGFWAKFTSLWHEWSIFQGMCPLPFCSSQVTFWLRRNLKLYHGNEEGWPSSKLSSSEIFDPSIRASLLMLVSLASRCSETPSS